MTTLRPTEGRVPPHDLDAEAAVLSAVLLSPTSFDEVQEFLNADHFYSDANRRVFEAIFELHERGTPIDGVTVASYLKSRERLQQIGGVSYLAQLTNATPSVANVVAHARTVREKWRLRQVIGHCQRVAAEGYGDCGDVQDFIDGAEQVLFDIGRVPESSTVRPVNEAIKTAFDLISDAERRGGEVTGVPSGFIDLDRKTSGMHPGELYVIAGRPGMGKTAFVLNLAVNAARPRQIAVEGGVEASVEEPGWGVGFFSLEMPTEQLAARLLASESHVDVSKIRNGNLTPQDWNNLTEGASLLSRLPIWLDDTPALTLLDLRAKVRRLQAEIEREGGRRAKGLGLIVIDYLQLMQGRKDAGNREQEISELSRGLKALSKEMNTPVIALSQLNRAVETRSTKDRRPQLSDLRESGAIEQDADAILFIYREHYYQKDDDQARGKAEVIIAKQRNGPTGTVEVRFSDEYARFENLAREEDDIDQLDDYVDDSMSSFQM